MSRTVVIAFYDATGAPLTGLAPSFVAYKTLAGVDAAPPLITELGLGLYAFVLSATDESTGVAFIIDGGPTALSRYWSDGEDPTAVAQAGTTVGPTPVNLFGVTPTTLYRRHFSQWSAPSTESNPDSDTVAEIIDERAAELEARLLQEDVVATDLLVTNAAAYLWCRETLRLMCAIQVAAEATQQAPPLASTWQSQLDTRFEQLDDKGFLALGGGVEAPVEQPDGPTTFIDSLGIDTSTNDANASSIDFPFHKDDLL